MIQDCKVCLAPHDEEIHAATGRVRGWFRAQVTQHLPSAAASRWREYTSRETASMQRARR